MGLLTTASTVFNRYSRRLIISAINVAEEQDRYVSKLLSNIMEFVALIGKAGSEAYFRAFAKTSLAMVVVFLAMERKPGTIKDLSQIVKKYADELDPFIATFQVFLEPELAPLREKTSETKVEKAKELRHRCYPATLRFILRVAGVVIYKITAKYTSRFYDITKARIHRTLNGVLYLFAANFS